MISRLARNASGEERGSVLVLVALWMPAVVLMLSFVINVGHWFEHKRHLQLQADAAALAGGDMFGACFNSGGGDDLVFNEATKYAGSVGKFNGLSKGTPLYNAQIGGSVKGPVSVLYQSPIYADGTNPSDGTETDGPCETPSFMFDVKSTESDLPWFLGGGRLVPAINAHARVQLRALHDTAPSLPLAVPDVNPKQVGITFVNEATGIELSGCSGANKINATGCTFTLTKSTSANGLNMWGGPTDSPATVTLPTAPAKIGVRVGLGGQVASCAGTSGTSAYSCFDGSNSNGGLYLIRDYSWGAIVTTQPIVDGVWPTTSPTTCSNSQFFSDTQTAPAATCAAGVQAMVDFGTTSTPPDASKYQLTAKVGTSTVALAPVPGSYDTVHHAWLWEAANGTLSLPIGAGAQNITFDWKVTKGTSPICPGTKDCSGSFPNIHRFYSAPVATSANDSGPVKLVSLTEAGSDAASLEPGSHTLTITVGVTGNYEVHTSCPPPPSGKNYNCPTDPTVPLRLKATNGNTTYAVDCGGVGTGANLLAYELEFGCLNRFSLNAAGVCPDPANPDPPDCAPINAVGSGLKTGPVRIAMNKRFAPGGVCLPNNYPIVDPTDKRVVVLMLTDFSAFNTNGSNGQVPIITYGAFYVTGWDGADPSCDTQNDSPPGGTSDTGEIWGHFITYVDPSAHGGSGVCDPSGLLPCVPVLTQ